MKGVADGRFVQEIGRQKGVGAQDDQQPVAKRPES